MGEVQRANDESIHIWGMLLSALYVAAIFTVSSIPGSRLEIISAYSYLLHIIEYAGLGFLLTTAVFRRYEAFYPYPVLSFAMAIAVCDEIYQSAVPLRTCSVLDVLADLLGAFLGIWIFALIYEREFFYGHRD